MKKNNYYTEFNSTDSTVSFVSKTRHFFERHIGVRLTKMGLFFKKIGDKFKEKFIDYEEVSDVRDANVPLDSIVYNYTNENKELYDNCVTLAHDIDRAIKRNENIDFSEEKEDLRVLVFDLKDSKDNYSKLNEIYEKLDKIKSRMFEKLMDSNKPKLITSDHKNNVKPFIINNDENKTKTNDNTKKEEVKKEEVSSYTSDYTDDYSRAVAKISLIDSKIEALKAKIESTKIDEINYQTRKIDEINEIISNAELFASKLHLPVNKRPKKVREMGNEFNLDTKEINDFKTERAYREEKIDAAEDKLVEFQKEIEKLEAEKEECNNEYITVKVPNQYAKDGFLEMRMRKSDYERKMKKRQLLDERIALMEEKKAKEDRIAKLKAELSELEGNIQENETKLTSNSNDLYDTNLISSHDHDTIVAFHKAL